MADSQIKDAGRGVFASIDIKKGEVVEVSPVLEMQNDDVFNLTESLLGNYYFSFEERPKTVYIVLGFGSLFNHSEKPSASYKNLPEDTAIEFRATRDIKKDEEITIDYNFGKNNPLWKDIKEF